MSEAAPQARSACRSPVEEEEQRVAAELEHVAAVALGDADQVVEDGRDAADELLGAGFAVDGESLGECGEAGDVDRDERAVERASPRAVGLLAPAADQARDVGREDRGCCGAGHTAFLAPWGNAVRLDFHCRASEYGARQPATAAVGERTKRGAGVRRGMLRRAVCGSGGSACACLRAVGVREHVHGHDERDTNDGACTPTLCRRSVDANSTDRAWVSTRSISTSRSPTRSITPATTLPPITGQVTIDGIGRWSTPGDRRLVRRRHRAEVRDPVRRAGADSRAHDHELRHRARSRVATPVLVVGNFIGTDSVGHAGLGNGIGIIVSGAS